MIVIEAVGLPGAGKSTTFREVLKIAATKLADVGCSELVRHHMGSYSKGQRILKTLGYVKLADWPPMLRQAAVQIHKKSGRNQKIFASLPMHEALLAHYLLRQQAKLVLLDQWTYQAVWSSAIGQDSDLALITRAIHPITKRIPRAIVYFDMDATTAAGRILERRDGRSRFDGLEAPELLKRLANEEEKIQTVVAELSKLNYRILRVDGRSSISEQTMKLWAWVEHLLREPKLCSF